MLQAIDMVLAARGEEPRDTVAAAGEVEARDASFEPDRPGRKGPRPKARPDPDPDPDPDPSPDPNPNPNPNPHPHPHPTPNPNLLYQGMFLSKASSLPPKGAPPKSANLVSRARGNLLGTQPTDP